MRYSVFFALVLSVSCAVTRTGNSTKRLNFVFMFPDTLRAEAFSTYGNALETTPNIDAFAQEAVRFENAHVMHTQCSPSRATMLTGRYMHVLGHRTQTHLLQSYEFNYFRTLKESGYHVQYYGKNDVFCSRSACSRAPTSCSISTWRCGATWPSSLSS